MPANLRYLIEDSNEIPLRSSFELQAIVQAYYADNAVSNTIPVLGDMDSALELTNMLLQYGPRLKGVTVFPEKEYVQAPIERMQSGELNCQNGGCGA